MQRLSLRDRLFAVALLSAAGACGLSLQGSPSDDAGVTDDASPTDAQDASEAMGCGLTLNELCRFEECPQDGPWFCGGDAKMQRGDAGCSIALTQHEADDEQAGAVWIPVQSAWGEAATLEAQLTIEPDSYPGEGFALVFVHAESANQLVLQADEEDWQHRLGLGGLTSPVRGAAAYVRVTNDDKKGILQLKSTTQIPVNDARIEQWDTPVDHAQYFTPEQEVTLTLRAQRRGTDVNVSVEWATDRGTPKTLHKLSLPLGALTSVDYIGIVASRKNAGWTNSTQRIDSLRVICGGPTP